MEVAARLDRVEVARSVAGFGKDAMITAYEDVLTELATAGSELDSDLDYV